MAQPGQRDTVLPDAGGDQAAAPTGQVKRAGTLHAQCRLARLSRGENRAGRNAAQHSAIALQGTPPGLPCGRTRSRQLGHQARHQAGLGGSTHLQRQPGAQRIAATGRRQRLPAAQIQAGLRGDGGQVDAGQIAQAFGGLLGPGGGTGQRRFGTREGTRQRRPHRQPQAVAGKARVGVALVFDVSEAVLPHIALDAFARHVQPRASPIQPVAPGAARHGRQPGRARDPQCLEQDGFSLIAPVVRQQHEVDALLQRHAAQRLVASLARPGFDAVALGGPGLQASSHEAQRPAARGPLFTQGLTVRLPRIGVRAQAMVDVQRDDCNALLDSAAGGGVKQRGRVAAPAESHRNAALACARRANRINGRWCR